MILKENLALPRNYIGDSLNKFNKRVIYMSILVIFINITLITYYWAFAEVSFEQKLRKFYEDLGGDIFQEVRYSELDFGAILKSQLWPVELPSLTLDIKFRHWEKLAQKREEALERGVLLSSDDDYVPATLRHRLGKSRVKVRLKGDWPDHLDTKKWSLRVVVKDGPAIMGMRRFSLQHPKTRIFHSEPLFKAHVVKEDLLTTRYAFVNVWVNGEALGIMAIEEHFAKEMLEAQGRREGPIVAFDESLYWQSFAEVGHSGLTPHDNYRKSPIRSFARKRAKEKDALQRQTSLAKGLLRAYSDGSVAASEVFDADMTGKFLALSALWGARHSVTWHNIRFYFNPVTAHLEPIVYDADIVHIDERQAPWFSKDATINILDLVFFEFVRDLLRDERIMERYEAHLIRLSRDYLDQNYGEELRSRENDMREALISEFLLLSPIPIEAIQERAESIVRQGKAPRPRFHHDVDDFRKAVDALEDVVPLRAPRVTYLLAELHNARLESPPVLKLRNISDHAVQVLNPHWTSDEGVDLGKAAFADDGGVAVIDAWDGRRPAITQEFRFLGPRPDEATGVTLLAQPVDGGRVLESRSSESALTAILPPIPTSDAEAQALRHGFLEIDPASRSLTVASGRWTVDEDLIIPEGFRLIVLPGAELSFAPGTAIISHGPVEMIGTTDRPVVLQAGTPARGWEGIVVLNASDRSRWENVRISSVKPIERGGWILTGGVTFYESAVSLDKVRITNAFGEDALNIVRSSFDITDLTISDTQSDALDADFSEGTIRSSEFVRVGSQGGGDAIDVSGSKVEIVDVLFANISDKALSVGEKSVVTAKSLRISAVGVGAVSKDGSKLEIEGSEILNATVAGLMAYQKKSEYEGAQLAARNITFGEGFSPALVQAGNSLSLDGEAIAPTAIDVSELYSTVMAKPVE